jgi:hypothetical protein
MADIRFKFYAPSADGGYVDYTVPLSDMCDYPWEPIENLGKDVVRAKKGKVWMYQYSNKNSWDLHFLDVSDGCVATMGSLARCGTDFLFIDDVDNSGGTGTCVFVGEKWAPKETEEGLWTFDFSFEEIE